MFASRNSPAWVNQTQWTRLWGGFGESVQTNAGLPAMK